MQADLSRAEDEMRLILSQDDNVTHWNGKGRGRKPKNWLGHRILEALQIHGGEHDASMQRLIVGWIKDGSISVRSAFDDKRNMVSFLTTSQAPFVAPDAEDTPF